ncbi:hypothetical protein [Alicyclobacillus sp. ALC3]|uniref:hypothetical protein n=1 Tax=Alicyclobacillus sp. ALC3 TaxID=2796143 RepID=UPI002379E06F|nr:hypothetical protein [Alicyclobacillus sp. ALC3]WDL96386.1 hypothetical protein JC200_18980 [Alicyclobacillus sp. ALC3]
MTSVQLSFMELLFPDEQVTSVTAHGQLSPKRQIARRARGTDEVRISANILQRYTGLSEIDPGEWMTYFPNTGKPWKQRDLKYLADWWGKDDVLSLAYALGRPPWGLQREICKMRRQGVEIAYQRVDKPREREMEYAR